MKTISALFATGIATIGILLIALMFGGCAAPANQTTDAATPVVPTTLVYTIDSPGGFDRNAIAYSRPQNSKPETFRIEGKSQTLTLEDPFAEMETDSDQIYNAADLMLADELGHNLLTDEHSTEISVLKAVTCKSILAHEPQGVTNTFESSTSRIYCYTQVALPQGKSGLIQHIWRHQGLEQHREDLFVQGPTYRTSSYKTMSPTQTGLLFSAFWRSNRANTRFLRFEHGF